MLSSSNATTARSSQSPALHNRLLLDEVGDWRHHGVDRLIESAVDPDGCRETNGADRGTAECVAGNDCGRNGRRGPIERHSLTGASW